MSLDLAAPWASLSMPVLPPPSSTALVLSAWRGQRGQGMTSIGRGLYVERVTAGSTAAARKCLLITCKIIIPPPDSGAHRTGHRISRKKCFPLTAGTHRTSQRIREKMFPQLSARTHRKCLLITHKKMNTPLLAGTHNSGRLTCGPTKLTGTEGFVNLVNMNDSSSSHRTMSIQRP